MALSLYPGTKHIKRSLSEIAHSGATHVALVATWSQADTRDTVISPGPSTIDDARVVDTIKAAHAAGLRVLLFPILTIADRGPNQWRGNIAPRDRQAWWISYERFVLHYAAIAAKHDVTSLLIGSELGPTETWRDRWYHLISRVERVFTGRLVYSANWDHYPAVSFWRRLDQIGVTGYFRLSTRKDASESQMRLAWQREGQRLLQWAKQHKKPLWITEVGYPSVDGATTRPWDYTTSGPVDLEEQRRAYAAFTDWWSDRAALGGVFFWEWAGEGGSRDRGYTPRAKPAETILRRWYGATDVSESTAQ